MVFKRANAAAKLAALATVTAFLMFGASSAAGGATTDPGYVPPPAAGTDIPPGVSAVAPTTPVTVIHSTTSTGVPLTLAVEPDITEPIDTVLNFSTNIGPDSGTCYWSTEYGFYYVAFASLKWDSGNCNTTSYPIGGPPPYDDALGNTTVTADDNGTLVNGGAAQVISFGNWYQSTHAGSIVGETVYVCGEAVPGQVTQGVYCYEYQFSPY